MSCKINFGCFCLLAGLFLCTSCASDNTDKSSSEPIEESKSEYDAPIAENMNNSSNSSDGTELIDANNINYTLISQLVHQEVNSVREEYNLQQLKENLVLKKAAMDQNNYVNRLGDLTHSQNNASKRNLSDRIQFFGGGFQAMAENLIYEGFIVQTTNGTRKEIITPSYEDMAKKMVVNWMNSPGHRRNLLGPNYNQVGTAVAYNDNLKAVFATQVFGKKFK